MSWAVETMEMKRRGKVMDRIQEAQNVCYYAHGDQLDKVGGIYMYHPFRVWENLKSHHLFAALSVEEQEDAQVAAILHDVIEDSPKFGYRKYDAAALLKLGFSSRSVELVGLLTRNKEVPNEVYYAKIQANQIASLIKWADIADNLNHERVAKLDKALQQKLADKYVKALEQIPLDKLGAKWLEERKKLEIPSSHWEKSRWVYDFADR
jgi:(p)ppGpp synthase/HD superfamily hydrolase